MPPRAMCQMSTLSPPFLRAGRLDQRQALLRRLDVGEREQLQRDPRPDIGGLVAQRPEFRRKMVERPGVVARVDEIGDDLDMHRTELLRGAEIVALGRGRISARRSPVANQSNSDFELDESHVVVGEDRQHFRHADRVAERDVVGDRQARAAIAGLPRRLDPGSENRRARPRNSAREWRRPRSSRMVA